MGRVERRGSRRYPGVRWVESAKHGRIYYIRYRHGRRLIEEKIGTEREGYTAAFAAAVRGHRLQNLRHAQEMPAHYLAVPEMSEVWKGYYRWAQRNKRSYAHDETRWRLHLAPHFGKLRPDQILGRDLEALAIELADLGRAPATVRQILILFGVIWRWGVGEGMIPERIERPRVRRLPRPANQRERALSGEEVERLLAELRPRSPAAYGLTLLGYYTGARKRELLRLRGGDVDLQQQLIVFRQTKTDRPRRVPINDRVAAYFAAQGLPGPGELLFPSQQHGGEIGTLTDAWQAAANRLFNPPGTLPAYRVVFHTLRHSFTSQLVAAGVPLRTVQELTGHRSLAMLERYSHLAPDAGRAAVRLLEAGREKKSD